MDCLVEMEPATSTSSFPFDHVQRGSSQVVPQLQADSSAIDESNIHKIALSLANPSPVAQKTFDFTPASSGNAPQKIDSIEALFPGSPRGFFSPNSSAAFNIFSMMTPTPTTQHGASPFVFNASGMSHPSPYIPPMTPQTTLAALTGGLPAQRLGPQPQPPTQVQGPQLPIHLQQQQQQQQQQLQAKLQQALSKTQASAAVTQQPSPKAVQQQQQQQKTATTTTTPAATPRAVTKSSTAATPASSNMRMKEEAQSEDSEHEVDMDEDEEEEEEGEESYENQVPSSDESDASYKHKAQLPKRRKRKASHSVNSGARCFEDLTDEDIAFMDFKELTRLMNAAGLTRQMIAETKARRRRLKNRQSARLCSNKKRELCTELAADKQRLQDELKSLQQAHAKLQREYSHLRQQYDVLASGGSSKRARE